MLTTCPECELMVSDKAAFCPHCGYIFNKRQAPKLASKRKRLPNGFGQISLIKGKNLRNPYRVMVPAGKNEKGHPISKMLEPNAYFPTYNDAYVALVEYHRNPYDPNRNPTFEELYYEWFDTRKDKVVNPATLRQYRASFSHLEPLHKYNIKDIRSYHIREAIERSDQSEQMKDKMKTLCNMLFDYALENELTNRNYSRDLTLSLNRPDKSEIHKAYTKDEMKILWENINEPAIFAQILQCYTGFRPDEVLKIRLEDIDMDKHLIKGGMKTEAGRNRIVPVHDSFWPVLKANINTDYTYLIHGIGRQKEKTLPIRYDAYRDRLGLLFKELKLDHHPHDGRLFFTTLCKKYNVDEYAIKYMVGHKIKDLTERVYTERSIEWLQKEISKIPPGEILELENIKR